MSMEMLPLSSIDLIIKLVLALVLGLVLGVERVYAHKTAGMRTYALVAMGAALFIIISEAMVETYSSLSVNPLRLAAAVISGIGFLGAGLIIFKDNHVANLTTAAGLWVAAGIGMAVGFGLYVPAVIATLLTLFVFAGLALVERKIKLKLKDEKIADYDDE